VDGVHVERAGPRGPSHCSLDRSVHRARARLAGRREADRSVDRREDDVAVQLGRLDATVDGLADEANAGRHLHGELDLHVVVLRAHAPGVARLAFVRLRTIARRIDRADGHVAAVRDDVDADAVGIVAGRGLLGYDLDLVAAGRFSADVSVDALDL